MAEGVTSMQVRAVEAVSANIQQYLDQRHRQVRRANDHVDQIWEDVTWQQLNGLRKTLATFKAYGGERFHVAEILLSDNETRFRGLFLPKSQTCLLAEVVESKEEDTGHRSPGHLEIHDVRSLFRAIDPKLESFVMLIQTFLWWDLEDAALLARHQKKAMMIRAIDKSGLAPEVAKYYAGQMGRETAPSQDEVLAHEFKTIRQTVEAFRQRRDAEPQSHAIIAREVTAQDNADPVVEAMGSQLRMKNAIEKSGTVDAAMKEQFSKAMKCDSGQVTGESALAFLENTIAANKKRLKSALMGGGGGALYNFKLRQLDAMEQEMNEVVGDRAATPQAANA